MSEANKQIVEALKAVSTPVVEDGVVRVYLTRRNLEALLAKLDANRAVPGTSQVTLVKQDTKHPKYPQTHPQVVIKGLEDEEYYTDREPGSVVWFKRH